jgi:hypothetical protein
MDDRMSDLARLRPALLMRLQFIDCMLGHYGTINRAVIEDYFALSTPQASADIGLYLQHAPGNAEYDRSARTYRRTADFMRLWP